MGLFKAIGGAVGGATADQWREYFYCDSLTADILMTKGQKRVSAKRSSNTKGEDNIISNGSLVAVNEGQFMIIVDQGKIVEFCGEAGEFTYDTSSEPSLLYGGFGKGLVGTFGTVGKRFTFGGDTAKDQRVYYFNVKEILGNKYGTANPIPFRVVDANIGLDIDISIRCNGEYSYKIANPLLFYANVCGNVTESYNRNQIDSQLKSELMTALQPAFARISAMGIRYSAVPAHTMELAQALNEILSAQLGNLRGMEIVAFGVNAMKASDEDEAMIKELQRTAVMRSPNMAAATLVGAQSDAMRSAAANPTAGPMMAFAGMNLAHNTGGMNAQKLFEMDGQNAPANNAGGMNAQNLFAMGGAQAAPAQGTPAQPEQAANVATSTQVPPTAPEAPAGWACPCGAGANMGKFCVDCGAQKAVETDGWRCGGSAGMECGALNKGNFCAQCGAKRPVYEAHYQCDKCGWEPEDVKKPPRFCPECGDVFDEHDVR